MGDIKVINGISVDVEEYYHARNLAQHRKISNKISRLEASLDLTTEALEKAKIKATFFILGEIAEKIKTPLVNLLQAGHEIAAHSFTHRCIFELSEAEFKDEAAKVKKILENITGKRVLGYRAPNFSITDKTPWAHEVLAELGYVYDSSTYSVNHPVYGNTKKSRKIEKLQTSSGSILSVPLASYPVIGINLPVAGGAYWRHLPKFLMQSQLAKINEKERTPFFCYFHPWELDAEQPVLINKFSLTKFRHYGNIKKYPEILADYFSKFKFSTYVNVLKSNGFI